MACAHGSWAHGALCGVRLTVGVREGRGVWTALCEGRGTWASFPGSLPGSRGSGSPGAALVPSFPLLLSVPHEGSLSSPRKLLQMPVSPIDTTLKEKQNEPGAMDRCCHGQRGRESPARNGVPSRLPRRSGWAWVPCVPSPVSGRAGAGAIPQLPRQPGLISPAGASLCEAVGAPCSPLLQASAPTPVVSSQGSGRSQL